MHVIFSNNLKRKNLVISCVSKANQTLGIIRKSFAHLDFKILRSLYVTFIRPLLEFARDELLIKKIYQFELQFNSPQKLKLNCNSNSHSPLNFYFSILIPIPILILFSILVSIPFFYLNIINFIGFEYLDHEATENHSLKP